MDQSHEQGNPFSTRYVRPGALDFFFAPGEDLSTLFDRLARHHWLGQIVGPHGSGKSTLLAALLPKIESTGKPVTLVALHDGQRKLPITIDSTSLENHVLVIDGYEQLSWWRRRFVQRFCRRHGIGLLITTHRSVGLPEIYCTSFDINIAERLVDQLLCGWPRIISGSEICACLNRHHPDLREALFELYDLFEQRRNQ